LFSSLFFLILTVLLINVAPDIRAAPWVQDPLWSFLDSLGLYLATLGWILVQNRALSRGKQRQRWLVIVNLELILFLIVHFFILGGDAIYGPWPSLHALSALAMYFGGLALFHYTFAKGSRRFRKNETLRQLKLVMPFAIPFALIVILLDALWWVPEAWGNTVLTAVSILGVLALMFFLPLLICQAWGCIPLRDAPTRQRLEEICRQAGFNHAGILEWTVMNHSPTAAIIGILPGFRYILFSRYLLHSLPAEAIDAILAHEIGHSQRKHMMIYPLIIMGMVATAALAGIGFEWALEDWQSDYVKPIALFICYALVLGLYFRFVFGYFSRIFERQADLHILELGLPLQDMITVLDAVGVHSGNTHLVPSWHHYSIAERIAFLRRCQEDPLQVDRHHRLVRISLIIYLILLGLAIFILSY
jgi:STE24 endopeptidase